MMHNLIRAVFFCSGLAFASSVFAVDMVSTKGQPKQLGPLVQSSDWTLVMLWAHDCIPCERQKPMIEKFHVDTFKRGVSIVGVSTDPVSLRHKAEEVYRSTRTSFDNYYFEGDEFFIRVFSANGPEIPRHTHLHDVRPERRACWRSHRSGDTKSVG